MGNYSEFMTETKEVDTNETFEQYMLDVYGMSPSALDALDSDMYQEYMEEYKDHKLLERGKKKVEVY